MKTSKQEKVNKSKETEAMKGDKIYKMKVYNLIVLDESGSMWSIKSAALSGLNETLQSIRSSQTKLTTQDQYVTIVKFNSDGIRTIVNCAHIDDVEDIKSEDFEPNACTPLYDAIGISVNSLNALKEENSCVVVTIITDGLENSSREYNVHSIQKLVEKLKKEGWLFSYIGANQDAVYEAGRIGIRNAMKFECNDEDVDRSFKAFNAVNCQAKMCLDTRMADMDLAAPMSSDAFFMSVGAEIAEMNEKNSFAEEKD